jgi:hypothetical protein
MKATRNVFLGLAVVFAAVLFVRAAEDKKEEKPKEVTLKGTFGCSKCVYKKTEKCGNAIMVKEKGKDVLYYLDDDGKEEKYHAAICTAKKKGSVKGVVSKKDGKMYIKPTKGSVKYDKDE